MRTIKDIIKDMEERASVALKMGDDSLVHNFAVGAMLKKFAMEIEKASEENLAEIAELKEQVRLAKKAFFNIVKCAHSQVVHDIVCEAEFMMNHPECRKVTKND